MDGDVIPLLAQLGIAAPFVFALGWVGKKIWDRGDRLEAEVKSLNALMFDRALPAMQESSAALREAGRFIQDLRTQEEVERRAEARAQELLKEKGA